MRKLLLLAAVCFAINASAQRTWQSNQNYNPSFDDFDYFDELRSNNPFAMGQKYQADLVVKESKRVKRKLRKARKGKKHLAKANLEVIPNREKLVITAYLDGTEETAYHLKLTNRKGKVIKSFTHLSSQTIQEIQLLQVLPGKYQLSLYAGIERRLMSTYDVNRY